MDDSNILYWPILIVYPEFSFTDLLTDCCEEAILADVISPVFKESDERRLPSFK